MNPQIAPIPLDDVDTARAVTDDPRPRMPEPLPVKLLTVDDAHLTGAARLEIELDAFYRQMLKFEREPAEGKIIYRAENFRLIFELVEPPVARDDMRALGIEVRSLRQVEQELIDGNIEYSRQKSLIPGRESLLLQDPAGNWVELVEASMIR
ncbi:MAG TPA: hypothetical protein VFE47_05830 [Tepidisphaeraceae bacterium]|jgi:hypothetical protein|nr:hypothetical protein [Tepidisphaeraceae bacterium]